MTSSKYQKGKLLRMLVIQKLFLVLLCIGVWEQLSSSVYPETATIQLSDSSALQRLPPISWYIEEGEEQLNIKDIVKGNLRDADLKFIDEGEYIGVLYQKVYWYRLKLMGNAIDQQKYLALKFDGGNGAYIHTYEHIRTYQLVDSVLLDTRNSGLGVPMTKRDNNEVFDPSIIDLTIPANKISEVWIRVVVGQHIPRMKMTNAVLPKTVNLRDHLVTIKLLILKEE